MTSSTNPRLKTYSNWFDARTSAQKLANDMRISVGIEKAREFGKTVYRIKFLPSPQYRNGWELRCEVVNPS